VGGEKAFGAAFHGSSGAGTLEHGVCVIQTVICYEAIVVAHSIAM
jgi:hypothetical protein